MAGYFGSTELSDKEALEKDRPGAELEQSLEVDITEQPEQRGGHVSSIEG